MKRKSKSTAECVKDLARHYDTTGKPAQAITVNATRQTLLRGGIKPSKRGGPLFVGKHEVVPSGFAATQPEQLDIEAEAPPKALARKRTRKAKTTTEVHA